MRERVIIAPQTENIYKIKSHILRDNNCVVVTRDFKVFLTVVYHVSVFVLRSWAKLMVSAVQCNDSHWYCDDSNVLLQNCINFSVKIKKAWNSIPWPLTRTWFRSETFGPRNNWTNISKTTTAGQQNINEKECYCFVACLGDRRGSYTVLEWRSEGKRPLEKQNCW